MADLCLSATPCWSIFAEMKTQLTALWHGLFQQKSSDFSLCRCLLSARFSFHALPHTCCRNDSIVILDSDASSNADSHSDCPAKANKFTCRLKGSSANWKLTDKCVYIGYHSVVLRLAAIWVLSDLFGKQLWARPSHCPAGSRPKSAIALSTWPSPLINTTPMPSLR